MGLISDNDERAYLEEIKHLENWCQENNLLLNVSKTKELIVDCSKKQEQHYQPVRISGTTVERVDSVRYLGVHISQDLSWSRHTNSLAKKAHQRLYHLRRLRDFRLPSKVLRNFYTCTIESILTGNITVWFGNSTKQDRQALQRVVRSAERITHTELPDLQTIYYKRCQTKARKIVKDPTHPNNRLFSLLRVDRHLLVDLLHACFVSREQRRVTTSLMMAIQNKLDFSYPSTVSQLEESNREPMVLSVTDCKSISSAIQLSACADLIMFDCQADDCALEQLFPALSHMRLRLGKPQLLQLILLIQCVGERDSWNRAKALSIALGNEVDLSHTPLDYLSCKSLGLVLENSEDLTHLNLSHCQLTDDCLDLLLPHLHKVQLLDIFNNLNTDMRLFIKNLHYQEFEHGKCTLEHFTTVFHINRFECEMGGEFQCRATELIFGMKGRGCVEYRVVNWDMHYFSKHIYKPDGPLYDIQTLVGEMYLLHLPHCETEADGLEDVFVAHIHEGSMQILTPVKMTCTHVTVRISGLSSYGKVRRKGSMTRYVRGQVLLFLDQISKNEQRIWVFLLSKHVSPIETYTFHDAGDADYHHSAFEMFIGSEVSELQMKVQEKGNKLRARWTRRVILNNYANKIKTEEGANTKENVLLTEKTWKLSLCNLLEELSEDNVKKLRHLMRNTTDPVSIPTVHVTPLLCSLHWLPVAACIRFKTLMPAYKAKSGPAPPYMNGENPIPNPSISNHKYGLA
ncbi:hypothetical protein P4O66_000957 [Electrophorus voltai]|uniref:FIIND domain-containing protein n=1 Tax=Electrophorus voltai TaxID=2609070 RepID=A0AAD8ZF17_9TELE|nr:hypothetical protein P4O66_000957 [Electrophorus voltai]